MKQKIIKTKAKEIFTKTNLPGADYVINQYIGCSHGCTYCYARFISRWKGHGNWGTWIETKINAPDLVRGRKISGKVFMSSVSDAYQPAEKELMLTQRILENLDKSTQLSILTKSDLILRDIDLLKQFKNIEVGFTVNSFKGKRRNLFEPSSPDTLRRIMAMKELKKHGIKTFAFVSPIIPELFDLSEVVKNTRDFADYFWFEFINLRGAGKEFKEILSHNYPESLKTIQDKQKVNLYIQNIVSEVRKSGVKIKGIEIH